MRKNTSNYILTFEMYGCIIHLRATTTELQIGTRKF